MAAAQILAGRSIIVTGAGKGIGRAIAVTLARHGAFVLVNNRGHQGEAQSSAARVVEEITAAGGTAVANTASVEQPSAAQAMVTQALTAFGGLDGVIFNAAIAPQKRIAGTGIDTLKSAFEINYFAPFALTQAALPVMREHGRLLYVISNGGLYGGDGLGAYAGTKAALYALMRTAAAEGPHFGITANAIAPFARSQMTQAHLPPHLAEALAPEWIGPAAAWLMSAECKQNAKIYVTGGGLVREARVVETSSRRFHHYNADPGQDIAQLFDDLAALPADRVPESATAAFGDIIKDFQTRC